MKSFRAAATSALTHTVRGTSTGADRPGAARPSGPARPMTPAGAVGEGGDSGWGRADS